MTGARFAGADPDPGRDVGLLSPVRAGTAVEAATGDRAWLQAMLDAEAGLARAQARLGTVPARAAEVITSAARADRLDARAVAVAARENANPVVALVQAFTGVVRELDPAAAQHVHRGSTSQDVLDTGSMLVAREALRLILADLDRCAESLERLAREHRDTVVAGRTLALQAVPTTFGLKAAGWRQLIGDARARVRGLLEGGLPVSLGGAAGTLAGYLQFAELDTPGEAGDPAGYAARLAEAFAAETGLAPGRLPWHALRTPIADLAAATAFVTGALGKIAVDVLGMARTEVGELAEPGGAGRGGSSAMPHKRNPVLATMIRSAALQVPALAAVLQQCLVSEDERSAGAWHAEWLPLRECLRLTGGAAETAAELLAGLEVRALRMRENLELTGGQVVSERVAAVLAPLLGKAEAKAALAEAARDADRTGTPLAEVLGRRADIASALSAPRLADLCEPARYLGAAQGLVDRSLAADADGTS